MLTDIDPTEATRFTLEWLRLQLHLERWGTSAAGRFYTESTEALRGAVRAALWELKLAYDFDLGFDLEAARLELARLSDAVHDEFTRQGARCPLCAAHTTTPE